MSQVEKRMVGHFDKLVFEVLDTLSGPKCWIAGGALRSFIVGEQRSDIDIFFPNEIEFLKATKLNGAYYEDDKVKRFNNTVLGRVDLVKRYFDNPWDTINNFDFTVAGVALDQEGKVYTLPTFWQDLAAKRLVINALPEPVDTLRRLQKYIKRGYTICNGGILRIADAIQALPSIPSNNRRVFYMD